jgi:hypothetical protein
MFIFSSFHFWLSPLLNHIRRRGRRLRTILFLSIVRFVGIRGTSLRLSDIFMHAGVLFLRGSGLKQSLACWIFIRVGIHMSALHLLQAVACHGIWL